MMCDYQMFWHEHRKRPALPRGFMLSGGIREVMKDDGSIVMEYQKSIQEIWREGGYADKIREARRRQSLLLQMFK